MINVLIVEDDPMVAEFNKRYLREVEGFSLSGIAHNVEDALEYVNSHEIHLILLDVYMPGTNGLELLSYIREKKLNIDVILITAASDVERIQQALRFGAVDYLIKPFEFERFNQALMMYKEKYDFFQNHKTFNQENLDEQILIAEQKVSSDSTVALPKGLTKSTLQVVVDVIKVKGNVAFSTDEIAEETYISRVSVRKYLKFLADLGILEESLIYGIGRPVYLYKYKQEKFDIINTYL